VGIVGPMAGATLDVYGLVVTVSSDWDALRPLLA
jgi:hypothetical protein